MVFGTLQVGRNKISTILRWIEKLRTYRARISAHYSNARLPEAPEKNLNYGNIFNAADVDGANVFSEAIVCSWPYNIIVKMFK